MFCRMLPLSIVNCPFCLASTSSTPLSFTPAVHRHCLPTTPTPPLPFLHRFPNFVRYHYIAVGGKPPAPLECKYHSRSLSFSIQFYSFSLFSRDCFSRSTPNETVTPLPLTIFFLLGSALRSGIVVRALPRSWNYHLSSPSFPPARYFLLFHLPVYLPLGSTSIHIAVFETTLWEAKKCAVGLRSRKRR